MNMDPVGSAPTTKELQQEVLLLALGDSLKGAKRDTKDLRTLVQNKNAQITSLEAKVARLLLTRTDAELQTQLDGLRTEVGKKDRELVDLKRRTEALQDNEKIILRRAASAEQKIQIIQTTMTTMQRARDQAHLQVEAHDRERLEAVRTMVDAVDKQKKAEARVRELEKSQKIVIDNRVPKGAPKAVPIDFPLGRPAKSGGVQ